MGSKRARRSRSRTLNGTQRSEIGRLFLGLSVGLLGLGRAMIVALRQILGIVSLLRQEE